MSASMSAEVGPSSTLRISPLVLLSTLLLGIQRGGGLSFSTAYSMFCTASELFRSTSHLP